MLSDDGVRVRSDIIWEFVSHGGRRFLALKSSSCTSSFLESNTILIHLSTIINTGPYDCCCCCRNWLAIKQDASLDRVVGGKGIESEKAIPLMLQQSSICGARALLAANIQCIIIILITCAYLFIHPSNS